MRPDLRAAIRSRTAVARRGLVRAGLALGALAGMPLRRLSGFARRDPELLVFGGNAGRFSDNARYLFLGLAERSDVRCVWIAGRRAVRDEVRALGHRAEMRWSAAGVRSCLRAGWYVYDGYLGDINFWLSRGARSFNLWHGIPMKAIEFDITSGPLARLYSAPRWSPIRLAFLDRFHKPDHLLSTSELISTQCFAPAFRIPRSRCLELGYPRTDHFFRVDVGTARRANDIDDRFAEVLGYFPTWRDDGTDFLAAAGFSFDRLNDALVASNRFLVFKAHPNFGNIAPKHATWSNLRVLESSVDLYQVLPAVDVLVTDYSSIAFDFLVLERPIVYFIPDQDSYLRHRNVYFSFDEMAVGPVLTSCDELYERAASPLPFEHDLDRHAAVREQVWDGYAGDSIPRIAAFVLTGTPAASVESGVRPTLHHGGAR